MNKAKRRAEKQKDQLGMAISTARSRLLKTLLFRALVSSNDDTCYRCNGKIESEDSMSMEHKIPWYNSENPIELFFDLDNVSFSHLSCNTKESRGNKGTKWSDEYRKDFIEKNGTAVYCVELDRTFPSFGEAGRQLGVVSQNIARVCGGFRKTAGGYTWRYVDKE